MNTICAKALRRIPEIEGLRAYLAIWVVLNHVLYASAYSQDELSGISKSVGSAWYAVDVFIIVSGFVIFYLLDQKRERYAVFITKRFFRLWPLFIILIAAAISVSLLILSNAERIGELYSPSVVEDGKVSEQIESWWDNIGAHILLHVPMVHGVVPSRILPWSPGAFLGPAWSILLEWQFYLVAPLFFALVATPSFTRVSLACIIGAASFYSAQYLPWVSFGAFLPMHANFFFTGAASYFVYKFAANRRVAIPVFPVCIVLAIFLFWNSGQHLDMLPFCIWLSFMGLLVDLSHEQQCRPAKAIGWIFNNPATLHLGKISYSIYLSHMFSIALCQYLLIHQFAWLSKQQHCFSLAVLSIVVTIVLSHFLFNVIEIQGMAVGATLARRFSEGIPENEPLRRTAAADTTH